MNSTVADRFAPAKDWFRKLFELNEQSLNGQKNHPLHQYRKEALNRLEGLSFPTRKNEDWKYTSVARVLQPQYQTGSFVKTTPAQIEGFRFGTLNTYQLVFVNGVLDPAFSSPKSELPTGLEVKQIGEALKNEEDRSILETFLEEASSVSDDPFVILNTAFAKHGLFIQTAKNAVIEKPIHIIHLSAPESEPVFTNPQLVISAKTSSEVTVIESFHAHPETDGISFTNMLNKIFVGANAHVRHYKIQKEGKESFQINNTQVIQQKDSTLVSHVLDLGGKIVRNTISSEHQGENISTNLYGVYLAKDEQHIDTQSFIDHAVPNCVSNELYKGIITDKAKGVFNGKVIVRQDAQKTNAFQQNSSLLLSPDATMDSKPQLEIFADDVRCSHGATIGQLDEQSVYYLRSRGMKDEEARSMLQRAFLQEVIDKMGIEEVKEKAEEMINKKFEE